MSKNGLLRKGAYLYHGARKRFLNHPFPRLTEFASEISEVCPAEDGVLAEPVTLPSSTNRAVGNIHGPVADYIKWATITTCTHSATRLYRIQDVVLDNGVLYKGTIAEHVSSLGWPRNSYPEVHAEQMILTSSQSGSGFFGDWLTTDNLVELLSNSLGIAPLKIRPQVDYPHLNDLNGILNLKCGFSDMVAVKNLYIVDDQGYNANKRSRLQALRSILRSKFPLNGQKNRLVYLSRGSGQQEGRRLINEVEIVARLERLGFQILDPSRMSAAEVITATLNCRVVVGVEGSQLAYGFLSLIDGGLMMTLQPPYHFDTSWRPRCVFSGLEWGFLVGLQESGGFRVPLAELEQVLEQFI